jgi:hypothetical protein
MIECGRDGRLRRRSGTLTQEKPDIAQRPLLVMAMPAIAMQVAKGSAFGRR